MTKVNATVVYYVLPTAPLGTCPENASCPQGQVCDTMDNLVEDGSRFPAYDNIMLVFMCEFHNSTKKLTVQDVHLFIVKGEEDTNENVIINMHIDTQLKKKTTVRLYLFPMSLS